jgi:hypothetical protein
MTREESVVLLQPGRDVPDMRTTPLEMEIPVLPIQIVVVVERIEAVLACHQ